MSRYRGNADKCSTCPLTYGEFRTGFTWRDVWLMFWDAPGTPHDERKRSSRGLVLGKWFEIKQGMWAEHNKECARQLAFEKGNGT